MLNTTLSLPMPGAPPYLPEILSHTELKIIMLISLRKVLLLLVVTMFVMFL